MTTLAAIIAGFFLFSAGAWLPLTLLIVVGLVQILTKSQMNWQYQVALNAGFIPDEANKKISDQTTLINMAMTVSVWLLVIYTAYIKLK